jgi:uncharacterized membrane protein
MLNNMLWCFFIYAVLGWCIEVIYAAGKTGEFVNRGFLNGPYCPIYGIGVILVIYLLAPVANNLFYLFIGSVLVTSALELIVGFLLEQIFQQKWWDYSEMPFNIGGYICLLFSLRWGLACLILVDRIHPVIYSSIQLIPPSLSKGLLLIFSSILIIDFMATVNLILKLNKKLKIVNGIALKIRESSDNVGGNIAHSAIVIVRRKDNLKVRYKAKIENFAADILEMKETHKKALAYRKQVFSELYRANKELLVKTPFGYKRLLKAFPRLKILDHKEVLEKLRNTVLGGFSGLSKKN